MFLPLHYRLNTNLSIGCVKLIKYISSAVNVVSSNLCIGASPRITIFFPLLSIWTDELESAPKIMTFFPKLPSVYKKFWTRIKSYVVAAILVFI